MHATDLDTGSGGDEAEQFRALICVPEPVDIVVEDPAIMYPFPDDPIGDGTIEELSFDVSVVLIDVIDESTFEIEISWDPDGDGQYERLECGCDSSLL